VRPDLGPGSAALHRAPLPGARPGLIEVEQAAVGCGADPDPVRQRAGEQVYGVPREQGQHLGGHERAAHGGVAGCLEQRDRRHARGRPVDDGQARLGRRPPAEGFAAFGEAWGNAGDPPAISVHIVSGLASPQYLVEIDAVAVI
jgi:hypothetical protein